MDAITKLLTRGVEQIYPTSAALEKVLRSGKKLKLYQGFDPTGTKLHLGHVVALQKLSQFQDLGHHVIFLIGDGTGQAGDPSGKTTARDKFLTREELRANARDYVGQAGKIVRFTGENPVEILYNGDWLGKLTYSKMLDLFQHSSVQQLLERDIFQERMKRGETINLREFIYPLLQGYDSVAMNVDLELGGTDQTFNMLMGRELVRIMLKKEKFVMTVPLLTDAAGRKIGKTEGNVIAITDPPNELFGKIMSLPDEIIVKGFELLTRFPMSEIATIKKQITESTVNPMELKKRLAHALVTQFHSASDADTAKAYFEKTVQEKKLPEELSSLVTIKHGETIGEASLTGGLVQSMSELKRLVDQGGLYYNNKPVTRKELDTVISDGDYLRRGAHRIVKVKVT